MNFPAKIKRMQAEIDELRARVAALEAPAVVSRFPSKPADRVPIITGPVQLYADVERSTWGAETDPSKDPWSGAVPMEAADSLKATIDVAPPIASATIAPPPKKRGRPPKA